MVGRGRYHLTTQRLKNWINSDIKNQLNLELVDNTSDFSKPVSELQSQYIDDKIKGVKDIYSPLLADLSLKKADLVNGVVPLNQLPLDLKMDGTTNVSFGDFSSMINTNIENNNIYFQSLLDFSIENHIAQEDPHGIAPIVNSQIGGHIQNLHDVINVELASKVSEYDLVSRLPPDLSFSVIDDYSIRLSLIGSDGLVRSTILSLS